MPAAQYNFSIEQGASFKMSLIYKDADENIKDLTGWCARLMWTTDEGVLQAFSTTNLDFALYRFDLFGNEGKLLLQLPASLTNTFTFENAKYDLEIESPNELYAGGGKEIIRVLYGTITIDLRNSENDSLLECQT